MIKVKLLFYGQLKSITNADNISLEIDNNTDIKQLLDLLEEKYPNFAEYKKYALFAIEDEFVDQKYLLKNGDIVNILLPASGG
jgi:molybdopterin converting factor small subunit